jgi:hypothetical protein
MEQPAFVRFLTLKKPSAGNITAELAGLYGHEVIFLLAVEKWRKQFGNGRITLEDGRGRPPRNDFCESLRAVIDETRLISCKCISQNLRIPKTIYPRVLREDLGFRKG